MRLCFLAVLALGSFGGGCVSQADIDGRYADKLAAWRSENPDMELGDDVKERLYSDAAREAEADAKAQRKEALAHGTGAVSSITSGNWIAALFHVIGLGGIGLSAYKVRTAKAGGAA